MLIKKLYLPDPQIYDEKELLLRIAGGNEQAFQHIFDVYWKGLFSYAFNVLESKEAAEDIVQEIFFYGKIGRYCRSKYP